MKNSILLLMMILTILPQVGNSQDPSTRVLEYEVNRIYPPVSITIEKFNKAQTLIDINKNYPSSWIKKYISVEISANCQGNIKRAVNDNDTLNKAQREIINKADLGSDISVLVKYIPDNKLKVQEVKEIDFSFSIDPDHDAQFTDGKEQLLSYLKEKLINNIPESALPGYSLATVTFTVDEDGHIIDPSIFSSSDDEKVDELLLNTICNMPTWQPAEYADGTKIRQEFALTVGNMQSCVVNLLNIGKRYTGEND